MTYAPRPNHIQRWCLLVLWLLVFALLLCGLWSYPAQRTQEARVLETARQMLGRGAHAWLIPYMNGELRLRKPPLPYWMAGSAFKLFGISEWAGRLPTVLVAWLTLGATYLIGTRWFSSRAGLVASACLLSSYLFYRLERLAETDAPAALFVTLAVYCFWRAFDRRGRSTTWLHLGAAGIALAFFSKGPPGLFPILFLVTHCVTQRRIDLLLKFVTSGAIFTAMTLGGAWYAYAAWSEGVSQFTHELVGVSEGMGHYQWFIVYLAWVPLSMLPWSLIGIVAIWDAGREIKSDTCLQALFAWGGAVFVPLCIIGNKQIHYLLPLMPCLAVGVGWYIDRALREARYWRTCALLLGVTCVGVMLAPIALPIAGWLIRGNCIRLDWIFMGALLAISWIPFVLLRRERVIACILTLSLTTSGAMMFAVGTWGNTINYADIRETAHQIETRFGKAHYVFYGGDTSLPLCFAMRTEIHRFDDKRPDLLEAAGRSDPALVVIYEISDNHQAAALPPATFVPVGEDVGAKGQHFRLYTFEHHQ